MGLTLQQCSATALSEINNDGPPVAYLAVISSVTRGSAKMQKMVTPSLTRSSESETGGL